MKSKLFPMLLLLALAGLAVAGDMNYSIYGHLHMSTQMVNDSDNSQLTLSSNTSRFGLKGHRALSDNYKLIWQFEQHLDPANKGGDQLANRNSFIGFKGDWGTWLAGIYHTPMYDLRLKTTFFFEAPGDYRTVTMGWDQRLSNALFYKTPKMGSFVAQALYRYDQNAPGADEAASVYGVGAGYQSDALYLGAAYETNTAGNYSVYGDHDEDPETDDTFIGFGEASSAIRVAGKYMAEQFGVSALFQTVSNAGGVEDRSQQLMGGEVLFKATPDYHLKGNFYMADPDTDADDDEYSLATVGVDRVYDGVTVYLQFAMIMNGDASQKSLGGAGWGETVAAAAAGESPYAIATGFWVVF